MPQFVQKATRRKVIQSTLAAAATLALPAFAADEETDLIPFLDPQPFDPKVPGLHWDELKLTDWITPMEQVYHVKHYGEVKIDAAGWKLEIAGLVEKPLTLTLEDIKSRPKKEVTATLECGGNGASPGFRGAIANVKWAGTPLAPILKEVGIDPEAIEIAFWGTDKGKEKIRGGDYEQNFARTLSIPMAMRDDIILCYEMNGKPLTVGHGFPVRLVVPGWFGVAWVKWLDRIEVRDRALRTRFIAKDYVTLRGEEVNGKTVWKETMVGPMDVKSYVARVTKQKEGTLQISGAAWANAPLKAVEISIDGGPWSPAQINQDHKERFTWRFWTYDWKDAKPGEHTIASRAIDAKNKIQPTIDDPEIKMKKTFWEANAQWPRHVKI
jgi:DMSO/TMAO reductase YedYZ molybdopterin-dependent catalytic subunit